MTDTCSELKVAKAKMRMYDILEARILIVLHNHGEQTHEGLNQLLGTPDTPEDRRYVRLALGSLVNKGLIEPSDPVGKITVVRELRPITGGFDHDAFIRSHELPQPAEEPPETA